MARQIRLKRIRETINNARDSALIEIGSSVINSAIAVARDPNEFADIGYIDQDIVDVFLAARLHESLLRVANG